MAAPTAAKGNLVTLVDERTLTLRDGEILREGDSVMVRRGNHAGLTGRVKMILNTATSFGRYQIVWVELPGGRVEGINPDRMEKVGEADS